jgi:hypothetical protein
MTERSETDPALDRAKKAYEDAVEPDASEGTPAAKPSPPVPNPDEDELTGIAPE